MAVVKYTNDKLDSPKRAKPLKIDCVAKLGSKMSNSPTLKCSVLTQSNTQGALRSKATERKKKKECKKLCNVYV
jgi:hypothetical protein